MPATLECARAGVTTGEWAAALREVFGEYRAPTGVSGAVGVGRGGSDELAAVREQVRRTGDELGERLRVLVGKPGLDGHSNGAEQMAVRARDAGFEVVYQGIRLTPEQIVAAAVAEDVHLVGLSILSGSHMELVPEVLAGLRAAGAGDVPVVVGGIIPDPTPRALRRPGVAAVFTPEGLRPQRDHGQFVTIVRAARGLDDRPRPSRASSSGRRHPGRAPFKLAGWVRARRRGAAPVRAQLVVDHERRRRTPGSQCPDAVRASARAGVVDAASTASTRGTPRSPTQPADLVEQRARPRRRGCHRRSSRAARSRT